jgi:hypothetical protein
VKKRLLLSVFLFVSCTVGFAQNSAEEVFSGCATNLLLQQSPQLNNIQNSLDTDIYEYLRTNHKGMQSRKAMVQMIPVVVHIIHNNGPENISNLQVQTAISNINSKFLVSDNKQIQFCLAQRDPNGNPTDGITRDISPLTN